MPKHILFLCSRNKLRSPTAEALFMNHPCIEVDSAGLSHDAEVVVEEEHIAWADVIMVMEKIHRTRLTRKFGKILAGKRIVVLDIPDVYEYMDPALVALLKKRCSTYFS